MDSTLRITGTTRPFGVAAANETSTKSLLSYFPTDSVVHFFQNYSLKHDPENNFVGGIVDNSIDSWFLDKSGGGGFDEGTHETKFLIVGFFEEILNIDPFYVD